MNRRFHELVRQATAKTVNLFMGHAARICDL